MQAINSYSFSILKEYLKILVSIQKLMLNCKLEFFYILYKRLWVISWDSSSFRINTIRSFRWLYKYLTTCSISQGRNTFHAANEQVILRKIIHLVQHFKYRKELTFYDISIPNAYFWKYFFQE